MTQGGWLIQSDLTWIITLTGQAATKCTFGIYMGACRQAAGPWQGGNQADRSNGAMAANLWHWSTTEAHLQHACAQVQRPCSSRATSLLLCGALQHRAPLRQPCFSAPLPNPCTPASPLLLSNNPEPVHPLLLCTTSKLIHPCVTPASLRHPPTPCTPVAPYRPAPPSNPCTPATPVHPCSAPAPTAPLQHPQTRAPLLYPAGLHPTSSLSVAISNGNPPAADSLQPQPLSTPGISGRSAYVDSTFYGVNTSLINFPITIRVANTWVAQPSGFSMATYISSLTCTDGPGSLSVTSPPISDSVVGYRPVQPPYPPTAPSPPQPPPRTPARPPRPPSPPRVPSLPPWPLNPPTAPPSPPHPVLAAPARCALPQTTLWAAASAIVALLWLL